MKKNNHEIEIKLLFKNKDKIISALSPHARFIKKINTKDNYYSKNKTVPKNNIFFLRIREIKEKNQKIIELTYKGRAKEGGKIVERVEITTKISSAKSMESILKNLGLNKISYHESKREYWELKGAEIVFTKFVSPAHLEFMEIEGNSRKIINTIVNKIKDFCEEMNERDFNVLDRR